MVLRMWWYCNGFLKGNVSTIHFPLLPEWVTIPKAFGNNPPRRTGFDEGGHDNLPNPAGRQAPRQQAGQPFPEIKPNLLLVGNNDGRREKPPPILIAIVSHACRRCINYPQCCFRQVGCQMSGLRPF